MHLVQTFVAYFQALDDLHFDLSEFNILDLKQKGEGEMSEAAMFPLLARYRLPGTQRNCKEKAVKSPFPVSSQEQPHTQPQHRQLQEHTQHPVPVCS